MSRWKVRKARKTGNWWVHGPSCYELGGLWCVLFGDDCVTCESFGIAIEYAQFKATHKPLFAPAHTPHR